MIINIEGVDGTGKTTLATELYERLMQLANIKKIKVVRNAEPLISTHPKRPGRLTKEELKQKLSEMVNDNTTVYIIERGVLSDIIYRTFDEYEPVLSLLEYLSFSIVHQSRMIIVACETDNAEELMKARGDDNLISLTRHKELTYIYKQLLPLFNSIKYDVAKQGNDLQAVINIILAYLWTGMKKCEEIQKQRKEMNLYE